MQEPVVSICCLVYNHEPFLRECFEGFVMQKTTFPIEILVHDDASTDHSADIIREYTAKYPDLFKPIYQTENQYSKGVKVSATFQFPRAKGKYIALCEGDDYWTDPYKLQKQVDFLESHPEYSFCAHNAMICYANGCERKFFNPLLESEVYTICDIIEKDWFIPTASILFRVNVWAERESNKRFANGDYYLQLLLLCKGEKMYYSNQVMSVYRKHLGGVSNQFTKFSLFCNLKNLLEYIDELTNQVYHQQIDQKIVKLKEQFLSAQKAERRQNSATYKFLRRVKHIFERIYKFVLKLYLKVS